jgi:hypothetical protein
MINDMLSKAKKAYLFLEYIAATLQKLMEGLYRACHPFRGWCGGSKG